MRVAVGVSVERSEVVVSRRVRRRDYGIIPLAAWYPKDPVYPPSAVPVYKTFPTRHVLPLPTLMGLIARHASGKDEEHGNTGDSTHFLFCDTAG